MCLKASIFNYKHTLAWLVALTVMVAAAGCSDDSDNGGGIVEVAQITTIILNPKSAARGDTVNATAIVEGTTAPGSFPSIKWTSDAGVFLSDNQASVSWVAPTTSAVYRLTCTVTTSGNSDQMAVDVFVGEPVATVPRNGGEIQLTSAPDDFYYLHSFVSDEAWDSSTVYRTGTGEVAAGAPDGAQFAFSKNLAYAGYVVTVSEIQFEDNRMNVYMTDLNAGTFTQITYDSAFAGSSRRHQYTKPYFSPDENWVTYQGFRPNPQSGFVDTLDVYVHDIALDEQINVTESDTTSWRRSFLPTYSTDFNWVVYVSDRVSDGRDEWDLYGQPILGNGAPNTSLSSVTRMTRDGTIGLVSFPALVTSLPMLEWNPSMPLLAVVAGGGSGADGLLYLVNPNGPSVTQVIETGESIVEFEWSNDGQLLAVSALNQASQGGTVDALYTVTTGGTATLRHTANEGDRIVDLGWDSAGRFIVYRVVRGADSWFELIDIDAGTSFLGPVVITTTSPIGSRGAYAAEMTTAARSGLGAASALNVYYSLFDGATPSIWTLDVSGALP